MDTLFLLIGFLCALVVGIGIAVILLILTDKNFRKDFLDEWSE